MISAHFLHKPYNITVIQVYAPATKAEVEWFYEDLQDPLELTPKKEKKKSQEILGVTGKFDNKYLQDPDNHDGVITHLEPDILECEVRWALGSITTNKAGGGDGIPIELF